MQFPSQISSNAERHSRSFSERPRATSKNSGEPVNNIWPEVAPSSWRSWLQSRLGSQDRRAELREADAPGAVQVQGKGPGPQQVAVLPRECGLYRPPALPYTKRVGTPPTVFHQKRLYEMPILNTLSGAVLNYIKTNL